MSDGVEWERARPQAELGWGWHLKRTSTDFNVRKLNFLYTLLDVNPFLKSANELFGSV